MYGRVARFMPQPQYTLALALSLSRTAHAHTTPHGRRVANGAGSPWSTDRGDSLWDYTLGLIPSGRWRRRRLRTRTATRERHLRVAQGGSSIGAPRRVGSTALVVGPRGAREHRYQIYQIYQIYLSEAESSNVKFSIHKLRTVYNRCTVVQY